MRNKTCLKRILSLMLAAVMLLSLCGCGRGGASAGGKKDEEMAIAQPVPVAEGDNPIYSDATIADHVRHNEQLKQPKPGARMADTFDLYVTNTETMLGFVSGNIIGNYSEAVQSAFGVAGSQFDSTNAYVLDEGMQWTREKMDEMFLVQLQSRYMYEDRPLPAAGVLPTMFRDTTPFTENGMTMILTNFVEPGFDVSALALGIENYFREYTDSAACVVGFTAEYDGDLHIPRPEKNKDNPTFLAVGCETETPFYMVLVGPQTSVRNYTQALYKDLESRNVTYNTSGLFTNTVYQQIVEKPLEFEIVGDRKIRSAKSVPLSSYNTGAMTQHASGYAYYATDAGVETSDYNTIKEGMAVRTSSQISLFTTNYDGGTYRFEPTLYVYKDGNWEPATKNAATKASFYDTRMRGPERDTIYLDPNSNEVDERDPILLASGRNELYLSATMDFTDGVTLSRDEIYRLEVKIRLNHDDPGASSEAAGSTIARMSISSSEYYAPLQRALRDEHKLEGGNFKWFGNLPEAEKVLTKTPNLNAFLNRLAELEQEFKENDETVQYLDFVFNLSDNNGSGRTGSKGNSKGRG